MPGVSAVAVCKRLVSRAAVLGGRKDVYLHVDDLIKWLEECAAANDDVGAVAAYTAAAQMVVALRDDQ